MNTISPKSEDFKKEDIESKGALVEYFMERVESKIISQPQPQGLPIIGCAECGDTYRQQVACVWTDTCTVHFRLYKDHGRYHTCTPCVEKMVKEFFKSNKMTTMPIIYNDYEIHLEFHHGSADPSHLSIKEMDTILRDFFDKGGQDYRKVF